MLNVVASGAVGLVAVVSARALGPGGRGTLVLSVTTASLVAVLCGFGTSTAARYLMIAYEEDEPRVTLGEFLGLSSLLVAASTGLAWASSMVLLHLADARVSVVYGLLTGVYAGLSLAALQLTDALHGFGHHTDAVATLAIGNLAALAGVLGLAAAHDGNETRYLAALAGASAISVVLASLRLARTGQSMRPRWSPRQWRRLGRVGRSGLALNLSQSVAFRVDRFLIGAFLGPAAVGTYSVAATLPELVRLVPYSLGEIVFRRSTAEPEYTAARHGTVRAQCLGVVAGLGAVAALTAPFVVPAVFGDSFRDAVGPLVVLAAAEVGIGSFYLDARRLTGQGQIGEAARAACLGLAAVLIGDLVLIPGFELMGAAVASLVGYGCMAIAARRLLNRSGAVGVTALGGTPPG